MFGHSTFSYKYGLMGPEELLNEAAQRHFQNLALTDINYTGACQEFVRLAPKYGIKPIIGVDFRDQNRKVFIGLAKNNAGFRELNDYLSHHLHNDLPIASVKPEFSNVHIIYPFSSYKGQPLAANEWIGLDHQNIHRVTFNKWKIPEEKLIIAHHGTFRNKRDFNAHRLLRAIDKNMLLSMLPKTQEGHAGDLLYNKDQYQLIYQQFRQALKNTERLMEECTIHFLFKDDDDHKNQRHYSGSAKSDFQLVNQLCQEGLHYRYPNPTAEVHQRLEKELKIISDKGFLSYFLINWRIVQYAREKGYFYVGRGSGANSIIAYLLRITDVDPIELDLYFERFINLFRKSPPDFDIDFSWQDREDMTQFIFNEFNHVALLGAYSTFQHRAVLRELGKVFGLPKRDIEKLQSPEVGNHQLDSLSQLVRQYSSLIQGNPSHLSIHAAGILISERAIHNYTATEMPPKGFPTVQFDMVVAEDIGLYKFDILSQRGLGKIKDCLSIIKQNRPAEPPIDIHNIRRFTSDEKVKHILRNAYAIGCFYVESPAMRMLLRKLQVDHYLGLVAASSVIRPGVAQSGMMREYIIRYRHPERRNDAHPILQDIMPETFGIMVYQEDVIKVAHYFAGLTLGEADVLRRGMSGKFRSREEFQAVKKKFFTNCLAKGHTFEVTKEIWRQIESFAGYAFAKGHSASYAVESYQSLYLKAYYPIEYMVATINNGGGFYRWEFYLHEARMHGAEIERPCVNRSQAGTAIFGKTVFLGLAVLKDLETKTIENVLNARAQDGQFADLYDCTHRTGISLEQVEILINIDAFRFTKKSKKELLWHAYFLLGNAQQRQRLPELFNLRPKEYALPALNRALHEDAFDEIELLGFPLCDPFALTRSPIPKHIRAHDLANYNGKLITTYGYLVTIKNTSTTRRQRMQFGTFIDRSGHFLDTVHFPPVVRSHPFRGKGIYKLIGKVVEEFDYYTIEVTEMYKEPYIDDPRFAEQPDENITKTPIFISS